VTCRFIKRTSGFSNKKLKYQISWQSVQLEPSCFMLTDGRTDGRMDEHEEANSLFVI